MSEVTLDAALTLEHRQIDAEIDAFVASVARGEPAPSSLMDALALLRRHIYIEEELVFPPLQRGPLMMASIVMVREHGELWGLMDTIEAAVEAGEYDQAVEGCHALRGRLDVHNSKEEPIFYSEIDHALPTDTAARVHDQIAHGAMPAGWRCKKAS